MEASRPAEAEIPERKVFLSRKTSFPIFSNDAGDSWLQLLNLVLKVGVEKRLAHGERVAESLNAIVTVGLPVIAEDLEVETPEVVEFPAYLAFGREEFERYYQGFEGAVAHAERCLEAASDDTVALDPKAICGPELAPKLASVSFDVVDGELFGSFVLRRTDVYADWPLEAMALMRVHRELAASAGLALGATTFVVHSARLHARDWERTQRVLGESFKRPLPLQVDHSGIFLFGNDGGHARAMLLDHDAGTIFWEDAFANPEDLSWYIVDAMPWLLPQHIRYVGQECASLMRAMRESECYLQG
jgi:hypothetical protein